MKKHILEGKTILGIKIADDKEALLFQTDCGDIKARCDADCCSHTWVENIELPVFGFPALVTAVEDLNLKEDEEIDYETIRFYGCKITTDKGEILIDYRNSSNGYYGGSLNFPDEEGDAYFYGGVYGQNISTENWLEINN